MLVYKRNSWYCMLVLWNTMVLLNVLLKRGGGTATAATATAATVARRTSTTVAAFRSSTTSGVSSRFGKRSSNILGRQNGAISSFLNNDKLSSSSSLCMVATTPSRGSSSSSSSGAAAATNDDDFDSVLDNLLEEVIHDAGGPASASEASSSSSGGFSSSTTREETKKLKKLDFSDSNVLSTSNSYWTDVAGMDQRLIDILSNRGITHFTPVQAEAFQPVLAGQDVICRSRTGTGKTLAFGLPSVMRLVEKLQANGKYRRKGRLTSMIVLCPTRELARQVQEEIQTISQPFGLYSTVFHGGVSYDPQARDLRNGIDILVGTPGRVIDHLERGNLDLRECDIAVLDEADEMLNMGFADDVETILEGAGSALEEKTQCLLFSATTPDWVKQIGQQYQSSDVLSIDATAAQQGARTATTVKHLALQVPPGGMDARKSILEDVIAVYICKDEDTSAKETTTINAIAEAAKARKLKDTHMSQKIFGKTIVFTDTKRDADELVSGGVFKSLTAQALHGDVGQKQRDATLNAFRKGSFNVLVATDVAARGIDIQDVDLVIQYNGVPRDPDTYVHRSGRTGRAGQKGVSICLFDYRQARDLVNIERSLGHGFKFQLVGPPSVESALTAISKTSAMASKSIPNEISQYFREAAQELLDEESSEDDGEDVDPVNVVAKCLAAISRRSGNHVQSRSLLTGEEGLSTVEMTNVRGRPVSPGDVMFTVSKLAKMSRNRYISVDGDEDDDDEEEDLSFESDIGKIQVVGGGGGGRDASNGNPAALFDMSVEDAKKLVEFSKTVEAGGARFSILKEMEVTRGHNFGNPNPQRGGGRFGGGRGGGYQGGRGGGGYQGRGGPRGNYGGGGRGGPRGGGGDGYYSSQRGNYGNRGGRYSNNFEDGNGGRPSRYEGDRRGGGGYSGGGGGGRRGGGMRGEQGRSW